MGDVLEEMVMEHGNRLRVHHILSKPEGGGWEGMTGHIDENILSHVMPAAATDGEGGVQVLICGPLNFQSSVADMLVEEVGFSTDALFEF